jgi:hypothetical protein
MNWKDLPEGYKRCFSQMGGRAVLWLQTRGKAELEFTLPPLDFGLIANLDTVIERFAPTETGREFLRALDTATGHEATAMQACVLLRSLGLPVVDWSEADCAELVKSGGTPS